MQAQNSRDLILWFFLFLLLVSIFLVVWLFLPFVSILTLSFVITGVFSPVFTFFQRKVSDTLASLLTCVLIFFILVVPITLLGGVLSKEAYDLYLMGKDAVISGQLDSVLEKSNALDRANLFLQNFNITLTPEDINASLSELGKVVGLFLFEQVQTITKNVFAFLANLFLLLLLIYFLLIDGKKLVDFIINLSPLPGEQDQKLIRKFQDMAQAILIGNGLCGVIQGVLGGLVFGLFGLKSPFLWGVIMAMLAFLPIIGIGAVFIPAAIYLLLAGKLAAGIFFIVFYLILSGGVEYIFKPRLVGKRVKVHTLLVFLSILGGLNLFGILGIVYGPLIVIGFLTLADIYFSSYRALVDPAQQG